jgi:hypothetical protein
LIVLASAALASCQLDYKVTAEAQNGHLVFKTVWKRFGPDRPASVERLDVTELSQRHRTVWEIESIATNGRELSQVRYGQLPSGFREKMPPEPLKVGQLYRVVLWGLGGMDETEFVISNYDINTRITVLKG